MNPLSVWLVFPASVRLRAWKKLASRTRHGLSLQSGLGTLHEHALDLKQHRLANVYAVILDRLKTGRPLGQALAGFAPPEELMLIGGGEESGALSEGFLLAVRLIEARSRITAALTEALAYPCVLFAMIIGLLAMVSIVVIPQLALISDPAHWTGFAWLLYRLATFITSTMGLVCFVLLLVLLVAAIVSLPLWTGSLRLMFDRIPPWSFYRLTTGTSWLFTISTLMDSGKGLVAILNAQLNSETVTPYLRERLWLISAQCGRGNDLGKAMSLTGVNWPDPELVNDLRVYAELPGFHAQLRALADEFMELGIVKIKDQAQVLKMVLMGLIGTFIIMFMSMLFTFQNQLTNLRGV